MDATSFRVGERAGMSLDGRRTLVRLNASPSSAERRGGVRRIAQTRSHRLGVVVAEELRRLFTWEERHRRLLARLIIAFCLTVTVDVLGAATNDPNAKQEHEQSDRDREQLGDAGRGRRCGFARSVGGDVPGLPDRQLWVRFAAAVTAARISSTSTSRAS